MMEEKIAKEQLEDEVGIYFEYSRARYDENTKLWTFSITNKDGRRVFRATHKKDFAPYISLSKHLKISFEELIANCVWIYGEEIEIVPNMVLNKFCHTQKGWLAVSEIVKTFIERFGQYAKDNLLKNITWKLVIDRNECSSSTYIKNEKPGWPNVNTRVMIDFKELEDKIINCEEEKKEIKKEASDECKKTDDRSIAKIKEVTEWTGLERTETKTIETVEKEAIREQNQTKLQCPEPKSAMPSFNQEDDIYKKHPIINKKIIIKGKSIQKNDEDEIKKTCTVHFDINGGEGAIEDIIVDVGDSFILPKSDDLSYDGYFFVCYSTDKEITDQYLPGDTFNIPKHKYSLTLYAIWGRIMFVSSEKLNIYGKACNDSKEVFELPIIKTLKQGAEVVLIDGSYQDVKNLWGQVIYTTEEGAIECIGFTEVRYLRSFAINDILIGNMGANQELAVPSSTPNLYASDIVYLWIQARITCYSEVLKQQSFFIKIIDEDKILKTSSLSPKGYTDLVEIQIEEDDVISTYNMIAWGSAVQGKAFQSGIYTIEIWHANDEVKHTDIACIASKTFILRQEFPTGERKEIYKQNIESSPRAEKTYDIGDIGPGGGIVFM